MDRAPVPARRTWLQVPALVVSLIGCLSYFLISRVVLDLYPFSTYSMYSSVQAPDEAGFVRGCHLLAVGPDGIGSDVQDYKSWDCPPWEDAARKSVFDLSCPMHFNVEDPIREHIRRTKGTDPAAVKVDLVRRVWVFGNNLASPATDHPIVTCRAVLR